MGADLWPNWQHRSCRGTDCMAPTLPVLSPPMLTVPTQPNALSGEDDVAQRAGRGLGQVGLSPGADWTQKAPSSAQCV